jgi:hypothetical protein
VNWPLDAALIVEHWGDIDQLGMLRQLGLAPAPPTTAATR